MSRLTGLLAVSIFLAAAAHAEEGSVPDWVKADASNKSVTVELTAAYDDESGAWTFNDFGNGEATLVVPEGWEVTVTMINEDSDNPHSVMVIDRPEDEAEIPMSAEEVETAIEGGAPAAPVEGIPEGEKESITFTAEPAGDYALYCGVPGHGMAGMWIGLEIDEEAEEPHLLADQ